MTTDVVAVTGAFGYSGRYIARKLLDAGCRVRTLTNSPARPQLFAGAVDVRPLAFDRPEELARSLEGVSVLINTYWVRFNYGNFSHSMAVENTLKLFHAAGAAGARRIVHVSITNPSHDSPFEYFRGKARLEQALQETGIPHTILRPAVFFGGEDILINNIAWMIRRFPVFGVFGSGDYKLQPIHVEDFAELALNEADSSGNRTIDAIGPETFTYRGLVQALCRVLGKRRPVVSIPPALGYLSGRVLGWLLNDVVITRDEIGGLMANLLCTTSSPPASGRTSLTEWATAHRDELGRRYASELARRR